MSEGYYVMGRHTSVSWHPTKAEADKMARQLNYRGGTHHTVVSAARTDGVPRGRKGARRNPPAYFVIDPSTNIVEYISRAGKSVSGMDAAFRKAAMNARILAGQKGRPLVVVVHPHIPKGFKRGSQVTPLFYHYGSQVVHPDGRMGPARNPRRKCKGTKSAPVGSPRQRSFCARMTGMLRKRTSPDTASDPQSCIRQALRRWKCKGFRMNPGEFDPHAATELEIYVENDVDLYRQQYLPIIKNLMRKRQKGVFDPKKAIKLFMYLMESGAKKYAREFSSSERDWSTIFSKPTREYVARRFVQSFVAEADLGNYDHLIGRGRKNPNGRGEEIQRHLQERAKMRSTRKGSRVSRGRGHVCDDDCRSYGCPVYLGRPTKPPGWKGNPQMPSPKEGRKVEAAAKKMSYQQLVNAIRKIEGQDYVDMVMEGGKPTKRRLVELYVDAHFDPPPGSRQQSIARSKSARFNRPTSTSVALIATPSKLEAEKIAHWVGKEGVSAWVDAHQKRWGVMVPKSSEKSAKRALGKVLSRNPGVLSYFAKLPADIVGGIGFGVGAGLVERYILRRKNPGNGAKCNPKHCRNPKHRHTKGNPLLQSVTLAGLNPPMPKCPFRDGDRIKVERARAWVVKTGNTELLRQFDEALKLQTNANRKPKYVTWKMIPVGDPKRLEMVTAMAEYGHTDESVYKPIKGSKKGKHWYRHEWGEGSGKKKPVPVLAAVGGKAILMPLGKGQVVDDWMRG